MISRLHLTMPRLPAPFDGLTVAVVSDVHADRRAGGARGIAEIVRQVNDESPDVVLLLGDMIHRCRGARGQLAALAGLHGRDGVFATLGNHEHCFVWFSRRLRVTHGPGDDEWRALYRDLGYELLVNEARPLSRGGARIWIVGVDDAYSGHDDLASALRAVPADEFRLVITHHPDLIDDPAAGSVDLILAGHTHGGQVQVPVIGPVHVSCRNPHERAAGLVRAHGTLMYVTRGAGEGLPLRIGCPREIPVITLQATASAREA